DQDVLDLDLLPEGERARDPARVETDRIVDEKRSHPVAGDVPAVAPENPELHPAVTNLVRGSLAARPSPEVPVSQAVGGMCSVKRDGTMHPQGCQVRKITHASRAPRIGSVGAQKARGIVLSS